MGAVSSAVDFVSDAVDDVVEGVGDVVNGVVDTVSDVGSQVDDFVNEEIPGGWITVGVAAGAAGAFDGLLGAESSISSDAIAAANATDDPIAALNAIEGWTYSDPGYLASIGASPEIIDAGVTANAEIGTRGPDDWSYSSPYAGGFEDYSGFLLGAGAGLIGSELLGGFGGGGGGGGGSTTTPSKMVPPVKPIQSVNGMTPPPVPKFSDAPEFNFPFSDVPVDYFETYQVMPGDAKTIGPNPGVDYDSLLIQALQEESAGPASANTGFTMYQTKGK